MCVYLLNREGNLVKKDLKNADVLNIFFPSLFPGKFCFQTSKVSPKFIGDKYHVQKSITKFRII